MKKHCVQKQIYPLLLLVFMASCNGEDKTPPKNPGAKDRLNQPKSIFAGGISNATNDDPYFVESGDTFAAHGPRNITRNMLQDAKGNYWFASWEGVICYDGKRFTNITLKEGFRHFHVFSVLDDKAGNLWFGTIRGGVYRYDPVSGRFTNFTMKDGLASDAVDCLLKDKAGNIWLGTDNGLSRYDGKTFTNFTTKDGLCGNAINSIIQDKTGKIWLGTGEGISCYDGKTFSSFTSKEGLPFHNVRSIVEDKTGKIWIGSENGLVCYDPVSGSQTKLKSNFVSYLFEDKSGNLWMSAGAANATILPHNTVLNGTAPKDANKGMGLFRYDGKVFTTIAEKYEMNDNQVFGIYEDKTGDIWFGTMRGVFRYNPASGGLTDFTGTGPKP